jgi:hypothetical protein
LPKVGKIGSKQLKTDPKGSLERFLISKNYQHYQYKNISLIYFLKKLEHTKKKPQKYSIRRKLKIKEEWVFLDQVATLSHLVKTELECLKN